MAVRTCPHTSNSQAVRPPFAHQFTSSPNLNTQWPGLRPSDCGQVCPPLLPVSSHSLPPSTHTGQPAQRIANAPDVQVGCDLRPI
eukprot:362858-Chlamydomonas_euryale.AAC.2